MPINKTVMASPNMFLAQEGTFRNKRLYFQSKTPTKSVPTKYAQYFQFSKTTSGVNATDNRTNPAQTAKIANVEIGSSKGLEYGAPKERAKPICFT